MAPEWRNFAQSAGGDPAAAISRRFRGVHQRRARAALLRLSDPGERPDSRTKRAPGPAPWYLGNPFENVTYHFTVASTGPGIFTFPDGSVNPSRAAKRGDVATLFITGEGAVRPSLATGTTPSSTTPLSRLPSPQAGQPTVTVGGIAAQVQFAGIPSGLVGVTQINFTIPAGVASGVQPVVVTVGNASSNTATITVQ